MNRFKIFKCVFFHDNIMLQDVITGAWYLHCLTCPPPLIAYDKVLKDDKWIDTKSFIDTLPVKKGE